MKKELSKWLGLPNIKVNNPITTFVKSHHDLQIEVGDEKQKDFFPQVKIKKWDNEVNFSARLVHEEKTPIFNAQDDTINFKGKDIEANFYEIESSEEFPEGGMEFDITLHKKPKTNVITFSLQTKGLDFFYQPELTAEEIANGDYRPEHVVGSYAVYYKDVPLNIVGGKEYKVGKVMHIYRPRIIDAVGNWVWGELLINAESGLMTVTIPQLFLNSAVYPIRHAAGATFGYTSGGASSASTTNSAGSKYSMNAENGTLTKISCYIRASTGTMDVYAALYSDNAGAPNSLLAQQSSATTGVGTTPAFVDVNMNSYSLVASTAYWLWEGASSSTKVIYWDAGAANQYNIQGMGNPPTWTNPITPGTYFARKLSIYATYTTDVTTTQTLQGKARITATTTQTRTGKARIQKTATQTRLGRARVQKVVTQTQLGRSRITKVVAQTVAGKARIQKAATQTVQGKSRVTTSTTKTVQGISRIQTIVGKTLQGLARISATTQRTLTGKSSIQKTTEQTISGKSRVQKIGSQTIAGKSRIQVLQSRLITGVSRIATSVTKTIQGISRILVSTSKTITGKSRIQKSVSSNLTGRSRIQATTVQNITGLSKIGQESNQTIQGISRVQATVSKNIQGRTRIMATVQNTLTGKSRITKSIVQILLGKSSIINQRSVTIQGMAYILSAVQPEVKSIQANAVVDNIVADTSIDSYQHTVQDDNYNFAFVVDNQNSNHQTDSKDFEITKD